MGDLERQLAQDRSLRDAARRVFRKELDHARKEMTPEALGERLGDHVGRRVDAASDRAIEYTERHGGKFAAAGGALAAGIGLWLARKPILARLGRAFESWPFSNGEAGRTDNAGNTSPDEDANDE